jgi:D-alanyl-lipoteichoic acid acyltransferase DltB (MBOAT superfamily)
VVTGSFNFETEPNPKYKTQYWNTSVQNWLKDCFYDPIHSGTGSSEIATYATFIISAFWHGIYWTYYVGNNWIS